MEEVSGSREDSVLGRRLGPYVLRRRIATGGMGIVFDAYHERLEREVALKTLGSGEASHEDLARFLNEARAAARLSHPNLVSVFDVGEHNGTRYLAMELVRGRSLYDRIRNEGPLDPTEAVALTAAACDGLQHAHDKGILHRDLKPANLLLQAPEGTPRITDFGVARAPGNQRLTATGIALGTPNYMSPEQAMGQNDSLDARADVWGMGAILYEALTGLPPFNKASQLETMQAVVGEAIVSPRTHRPEIPADVEAIVLRCLSKPREKRYPSAFELAEDLRRTLRGEPLSEAAAPAAPAPRGLVYLFITTIFVVGILAAFLAGLFVARRQKAVESPSPSASAVRPVAAGLEAHLAELGRQVAVAKDDATLAELEANLTLASYRKSAGDDAAGTSAGFEALAAPLRSALAWRRYELGADPRLSHAARAACLDPSGSAGLEAWTLLAGRIQGEGRINKERIDQARRIQRFLSTQAATAGQAAAQEATGRLSLRLLDFDTAGKALESLESPAGSELSLLSTLSHDLAGRERLGGSLHTFATSDRGPCLVTVRDHQIQIRVPGTMASLGYGGRPSVIAAADVLEGGGDELLCADNSGPLCSMTLLPLRFEGERRQPGVSVGRYVGHCYGLCPGDVEGDGTSEFLVLTGDPKRLSLLQIDRATRRPSTRLVFPNDEVVEGHWDRGLLLNLDGAAGDEVLLASSRAGSKLLARRAKDSERSRPAGDLDLGPVARLSSFTPSAGQAEEGQERALAVVSAGPQAGLVVLGAGEASLLEVLGRWPAPAGLSDTAGLEGTIFTTRTGERLVLRSYSQEDEWILEAVPLAELERGASLSPVTVCRAPSTAQGTRGLLAGNADEDTSSELVISSSLFGFGEPKPLSPPSELSVTDAYAALRSLSAEPSAEAFLASLSARDRGRAELTWLRLLARRAELDEQAAQLRFGLAQPAAGVDRLRRAEAGLGEVVSLAERVAREADLSPSRRWEARETGLQAAARLGDWAAATRLCLGASPEERVLAKAALDEWQQRARAHQGLRVVDYDPGEPAHKFAVSQPGRMALAPKQPLRLRLDSHAEEGVFTELQIEPSSLLEFEFEFELHGGVANGVIQCGLLERSAGGTLTTGVELWTYNTSRSKRPGFIRFVVGSQPVSSWVELPRIWGRLRGKLRAELGVTGGFVSNQVSLDDEQFSSYRGRLNFRYTLPREATFGAVAPANANGYREDARFPRRGFVDLHRLAIGFQGGAQVAPQSQFEARAALGDLARGDQRGAIQQLTRVLASKRDPDVRALAFLGRAVAHARAGDLGQGLIDLERAYSQFPHRVVWWLELCGEDLRGADARLVVTFLAALARSEDPLRVAVSRSLRGDLWSEIPSGDDDRSQSLAAYLRFRQAHLQTKVRYQGAQIYQKVVGRGHLQLPWDAFPAIVSPTQKPLDDERLQQLLGTSGSLLRRYVAYSIAAQGRPEAHIPQLRLGEVYRERKLLGDALAAFRRARDLAPVAERPAIEVELAAVYEGLGELARAAKQLQAALAAGASREGLAARFPGLAGDPRYRSLFQ